MLSSAPLSTIMERAPNSWRLVIKVKHGDALKRFSTYVYGHSMDLNMMNLRTKIIDLFKLKPGAHIALTYVDDDGDTVALDTDDELCDAAINQHLNPLRINVQLSSATIPEPSLKTDSEKSRNASPLQQADNLRHITSAVDNVLNSIPEPFCGSIPKAYHESLSKAIPAVSDIVDLVTKLAGFTVSKHAIGESSGMPTRVTPRNDVNVSTEAVQASSDTPVKTDVQIPELKKDEGPISKDKKIELPGDVSFKGYPSVSDLLFPPFFSDSMANQDKKKSSFHEFGNPNTANSIPWMDTAKHMTNQDKGKSSFHEFGKPYTANSIPWMDTAKHYGPISKDKNSELPGNVSFKGYPPLDELLFPPFLSVGMTNEDKGKSSFYEFGKLYTANSIPLMDAKHNGLQQCTSFGEDSKPLHSGTIPNSSNLRGGAPFFYNSQTIVHPDRRVGGCHDNMFQTFHIGIECDGCGMYPIIGDRFKSTVKENYDLCNLCFTRLGKEADYVRIDKTNRKPPKKPYNSHSRKPGSLFCDYNGMSSRGDLESDFVQDVTVLDGTLMAPSTPFTKIWRMCNSGASRWPYGTQLVWVGGDQFSNQISVNLRIPLEGHPVEGEIDIAVDFVSPSLSGRYVSYWRLALPNGQNFGQRVWVIIQVKNSQRGYVPANSVSSLNLNLLPPENCGEGASAPMVSMGGNTDFFSTVKPAVKLDELSGSYNNSIQIASLHTGGGAVAVVPKASYTIIDHENSLPQSPVESDTVEQTLLKELESMGFKKIDLNKEVLRLNDYDLEQSVDDLCGYAKWDPLLSELEEMGFPDKEKNKKLLIKYDGGIKLVVIDLVANEIS